MRWRNPQKGDYRIIETFLLFPRTIDEETRWFEICYIKQRYNGYLWYDWLFVEKCDYENYKKTGEV